MVGWRVGWISLTIVDAGSSDPDGGSVALQVAPDGSRRRIVDRPLHVGGAGPNVAVLVSAPVVERYIAVTSGRLDSYVRRDTSDTD
jgi:hypothetical protein